MKRRAFLLLAPASLACLSLLAADEPSQVPPSRVVGSIDGKAVKAGDIGLTAPIDPAVKFDSRDVARWELMGRILGRFGGPVLERFVEQRKIAATAEEIEKFKRTSRKMNERNLREFEARLAELKSRLAAPDLSDEEQAKLQEEQAMYEKLAAVLREPGPDDALDELARGFIVAWKTERELHRVYGGRVIFQQAGPEALDARRRLFEAAEKRGDLKFDDPGVRHLFYYYANMPHTVIDAKSLDRPWFSEDPR